MQILGRSGHGPTFWGVQWSSSESRPRRPVSGKTEQSERASQVPSPTKLYGLPLVPNLLTELETHFPTQIACQSSKQSHPFTEWLSIHKKARWCPGASQREVSRTQSHFPFSQGKKTPKTQCSLSHSTCQTAFTQAKHYTPAPCCLLEQACPSAFKFQGDSTYHTLHSPMCKLLCSWSALPRGYLHMRPAPQGW